MHDVCPLFWWGQFLPIPPKSSCIKSEKKMKYNGKMIFFFLENTDNGLKNRLKFDKSIMTDIKNLITEVSVGIYIVLMWALEAQGFYMYMLCHVTWTLFWSSLPKIYDNFLRWLSCMIDLHILFFFYYEDKKAHKKEGNKKVRVLAKVGSGSEIRKSREIGKVG